MKANLKWEDVADLSKMDDLALLKMQLGMAEHFKKVGVYDFCDDIIDKLKKEIKIEERKRKLDRLI